MKRTLLLGLVCLIALNLALFTGCDGDKSTDSGETTLIGKWDAVKEVLPVEGVGNLTLTPQSSMFMHIVIDVKEDSTFEYEMWTGSNKADTTSGYESGNGTWTASGNVFSMTSESTIGTDPFIIEGTYKLTKNTLVINATLPIEEMGEEPVPIEITLNRIG
ncbi:hypothetical protein JW948_05175 [bacterium]|nr:hypothetical protein [bacterium]